MKAIGFSSVQETINYIGGKRDSGYVIFSNNRNIAELAESGLENTVLCTTAGEYTPKGYQNGTITGFEYDRDNVETVEIMYPPAKSMQKLKEAYNKVKGNHNAFALLLCDGLSGMEETILTTLYFTHDGFKIIGGSAGDNLKFEDTLIYIGNKRVHSVALFFNNRTRTNLIKENIYVPTEKRMLVTDADVISRTVKTFNNKPASAEYAKALGISEAELPAHFMNNPLGKIYDNDIYIASPMKVNKDKSITFYCQLMPNTFVQVLQPADPIEVIQKTIRSVPFKPKFVFAVNCILRSLKFQQENLWKDIDRALIGLCPNTSGFISYGEQYYKMHFNQTMVLLVVE